MNLNLLKEQIQGLKSLPDESWQLLSVSLQEKIFREGEFLLKQGQVCHTIFFVNTGYCRSFCVKEGNEISLHFYFENDFVTNTKSLVTGTPSAYCIQASREVQAILFEKAALLDLYKKSSEIESFGRKLLEQLLIRQEQHSDLFKILSPKERYAYLVTNHPAIVQQVPLTHIASFLGIARETLSRIRNKKY